MSILAYENQGWGLRLLGSLASLYWEESIQPEALWMSVWNVDCSMPSLGWGQLKMSDIIHQTGATRAPYYALSVSSVDSSIIGFTQHACSDGNNYGRDFPFPDFVLYIYV